MNVSALIEAIVGQTTVLLAQLATAEGGRAQLAQTANQVFLSLVRQLKEQGLSSKVIADMFGIALRTYQEKVRRLSESRSATGRSLWEAVLDFIETNGPATRADVLQRFARDDAMSVRGVLADLVQSGVVYRTGRGDGVTYRAVGAGDLGESRAQGLEANMNLLWVTVQRAGTMPRSQLKDVLPFADDALDAALAEAERRGHLQRSPEPADASDPVFQSNGCVLPCEDPQGWEASVFDHYQAMVAALCAKLNTGQQRATAEDRIGGSTFGFAVWPEHPHYEEAIGLLKHFREQGTALREKISDYNARHPVPEEKTRVVTYVGQYVVESDASRKNEIAP